MPSRTALLLATAVGAATLTPAAAAPAPSKLYLRSAAGSYLADWQADPRAAAEGRAPAGSTLATQAPARAADATARHVGYQHHASARTSAGEPGAPTFALPYAGALSSVCLDVWVQANVRPVPTNPALYLYVFVQAPGGPGAAQWYASERASVQPYDGTLTRVRALVPMPPGTNVPAGSSLVVAPFQSSSNPDWLVAYDSTAHPSSVTLNARSCPGAGTPVATLPPGYPKAGCSTFLDDIGDARLGSGATAQGEPSLDITGVALGTTRTHLTAYVRVDKLASRPALAAGYQWFLTFVSGGKTVTASRLAYYPDQVGAPHDAAATAGATPPRTVLDVAGTPVPSALTVTFDTARSMVVFAIPLADLAKSLGRLAPVLTQVTARDAAAYPPAGTTVGVDSTGPGNAAVGTAAWRVGDNRCFPVARKR